MMPMMSHASASSRQVQPRHARDTVRWTIHVDRRWRDRVMDLSDAERASITDVMDRILRAYFEAGSCARED